MNYIKILGASGSKTQLTGSTSFQIYKDIIVDAGNVINTLGDDTLYINHIFLTHTHFDHIIDLPFIIESYYEQREQPLTVYASKETIDSLKEHTFNDKTWPDFSKINLIGKDEKSLIYRIIEPEEIIELGPFEIKPIIANHMEGSYGFTIIKDNLNGYVISGDTYENKALWDEINSNNKIKSLIIECSFPSSMSKLAYASKHLTPKILKDELQYLHNKDLQIFIYHLKPSYHERTLKEIKELGILSRGGKVLKDGDVIHINTGLVEGDLISQNKFERIMEVNLELSSELNKDKLFEMILTLTRELTQCEAGTLYIMSKDKKRLEFKVVQNDPLDIFMGGTKDAIKWNDLDLYLEDGSKNQRMVATVCALENKIINIPNVYSEKNYDFSGTKEFDKMTKYNSKSMLLIPLINHEDDVIGVIQLLNKNKVKGKVIEFNYSDEKIIKALASQAAMALTNNLLIHNLEEFLNSFIQTIGHAIDAKSHHTMKHIEKVAKISSLLAKAINDDKTVYKDITYDENDYREIELASWLHDIGKISIPESIIDKRTKLHTLIDRIELIKERFEILKRDLEISYLKKEISKNEYQVRLLEFDKDIEFLEKINIGGEYMDDSQIEKIERISNYTYKKENQEIPFLNDNEKYNLSIRAGTLTKEEKEIMNGHAKLSFEMLKKLPFPKKYSNVSNIASNHHEKLNGEGYPRGLDEKDLTLEDRILILADIFEALTSYDRPYKDAMKLSKVFNILSSMAKRNEIDPTLLKFLHENEILHQYEKEELLEHQIDKSELDL